MSKHSFIMLLGCLTPLVALAVLWAVGVSDSYLLLGVVLLCPLLHFLMMWGKPKSGGSDSGHVH